MLYTVKEVSALSKVTIKALHHYHRIGLLMPCEISDAGYRLYGMEELERLQQILFYKELDFPLETIKKLLEEEPDRTAILSQQEQLLAARRQRLDTILLTLRKTIESKKKGVTMNSQDLFKGFESEDAWKEALSEQNEHLKEAYNVDLIGDAPVNVQEMNEQAAEAAAFMKAIAQSLREGLKHNDESIRQLLRNHLIFMNEHGHQITTIEFAAQTRFFLQDDFHLRMLEEQQTGLAYYLAAAADALAADAS